MSIPSISSCYQTPMSSVRSDFQNFTRRKNASKCLESGNQDQVTISENALSASLAQLTSDFSKNATSQASSSGSSQSQNPMQAFQNDLQALEVS